MDQRPQSQSACFVPQCNCCVRICTNAPIVGGNTGAGQTKQHCHLYMLAWIEIIHCCLYFWLLCSQGRSRVMELYGLTDKSFIGHVASPELHGAGEDCKITTAGTRNWYFCTIEQTANWVYLERGPRPQAISVRLCEVQVGITILKQNQRDRCTLAGLKHTTHINNLTSWSPYSLLHRHIVHFKSKRATELHNLT